MNTFKLGDQLTAVDDCPPYFRAGEEFYVESVIEPCSVDVGHAERGHVGMFFESRFVLRSPSLTDVINHPPHYAYGPHEAIDVIEAWDLGYHLSTALKYLARCKRKGNELQDLKKCVWYVQRRIAAIEKEGVK